MMANRPCGPTAEFPSRVCEVLYLGRNTTFFQEHVPVGENLAKTAGTTGLTVSPAALRVPTPSHTKRNPQRDWAADTAYKPLPRVLQAWR